MKPTKQRTQKLAFSVHRTSKTFEDSTVSLAKINKIQNKAKMTWKYSNWNIVNDKIGGAWVEVRWAE